MQDRDPSGQKHLHSWFFTPFFTFRRDTHIGGGWLAAIPVYLHFTRMIRNVKLPQPPKGMHDGEKHVSCRFLSGVLTGFLCFSCLPTCAPGINRL